MQIDLRVATATDIDVMMPLVGMYHEFEGIALGPDTRADAIMPLLDRGDLGRIWLIVVDEDIVGYIAVCFGYSIEFAGRDAFVDEFFIRESYRGQGIGRMVLERIPVAVRELEVCALHLEVAKTNSRVQRLYAAAGFKPRSRYQLMTLHLNARS